MRKILYSIVGVGLLSASLSPAAAAGEPGSSPGGIRIGVSYPISTDNPKNAHYESHLAVDPNNSRHMLATSTVHEGEHERSYIYVTFDGGRRWTRGKTKSGNPTLFSGGDGVVYFNRRGTAFFVAGANVHEQSKTLVGRSTDGGLTWADPLLMPYRDRPWLAFDESGAPGRFAAGPLDHAIYLGGMNSQQTRGGPNGTALVFSRSIDDGRTFTNADLFLHDDGGADREATINLGSLTDMIVAPGGALVMPFSAFLEAPGTPTEEIDKKELYTSALRVLVSDDGGRTFGAMRSAPPSDALKGFRGTQASGAERAAMDMSHGPDRGRLYVVRSSYDRKAGRYRVTVLGSPDLGKTWSEATVNDDSVGHDPSNPAIAVNNDGVVAVTWNDRRDDPKGVCWRLYGAISVDGGRTFLPNVRMSDAPTCTNSPANWQLTSWSQVDTWTDPTHPLPGFGLTAFVPVRFPNGGDTQGLAADRDGHFHAAWINGVSGVMQLWLTDFGVEPELAAKMRAAGASKVSTAKTPPPEGKDDLTHELEVDATSPAIDFEKGTLSVSVRITNPTSHAVRGPIDLVLARLVTTRAQAMGLAHLRVANADDGGAAEGARWTFDAASAKGGLLPPKGKTPPRTLRFAFDGGIPSAPDGYFEPVFFIYGQRENK